MNDEQEHTLERQLARIALRRPSDALDAGVDQILQQPVDLEGNPLSKLTFRLPTLAITALSCVALGVLVGTWVSQTSRVRITNDGGPHTQKPASPNQLVVRENAIAPLHGFEAEIREGRFVLRDNQPSRTYQVVRSRTDEGGLPVRETVVLPSREI